MKKLLPLLLLLASCGEDDPKPKTATPEPYTVSYNMVGLESVRPTLSVDLSSTAPVDWLTTFTSPLPASTTLPSTSGSSTDATDQLTVTITVPTQPSAAVLNNPSGANLEATATFGGHTQTVRLSALYLADPAHYGPTGATMSVTLARP